MNKSIDSAMHECYVELFKNANPPADFDKLVEDAHVNEYGQKEIPFLDYEIDEKLMMRIIQSILKKYKIESYQRQQFKNAIFLGCSPKTKK